MHMNDCRGMDVSRLLRQREPFVMVDRMEQCSLTSLKSSFTVRDSNLMVNDGELTAAGLLENICQTCSLRLGLDCMLTGRGTAGGVVASVRDFEVKRNPKVGETLRTSVYISDTALSFIRLYCSVDVDGQEVADGYITVVIQNVTQP